MNKVAYIYNADCIVCGKVEKQMIRVGAFYVCNSCFDEEFLDKIVNRETNEINVDSEVYKKYLEIWKISYKD